MMIRILNIFVLIVLAVTLHAQGNGKAPVNANSLSKGGFLSIGQEHNFVLKKGKAQQINIVFYPRFRYRIVLSSSNEKHPIEWKLTNAVGEVLFSNSNKAYIRTWDFQFSAIMTGVAYVKLPADATTDEPVKFIIAYKPQ